MLQSQQIVRDKYLVAMSGLDLGDHRLLAAQETHSFSRQAPLRFWARPNNF